MYAGAAANVSDSETERDNTYERQQRSRITLNDTQTQVRALMLHK